MKKTSSSDVCAVNTGKRAFLKTAGVAVAALAAAPILASATAECHASGHAKKIILAIIRVKKDGLQKFFPAAKAVVEATRKEPGNVSYVLLANPEDAQSFYFVEHWKDQAAIEAHFAAEHFKTFGKALGELAEGAPKITIYDIAAEKVA
ncbi:MAG: antibiotic biosynthesis monooxygenase [Puniceicoccales bacterium]|jgi:quinol monooxygenase YgiN|nr:antibiotic biosynthesis monooxygenase [Puniceicoccales bacterium]